MLAVSVRSPHQLEAREVASPEQPGPEEVLLWTVRDGICGSDLHILHGSNPFARYPRIIGREFAGHRG
jgi:L-gulonate 5-dehydrogenase